MHTSPLASNASWQTAQSEELCVSQQGRDRSHYDEIRNLLTIKCNSITDMAEKSLRGSCQRRWAFDPPDWRRFAHSGSDSNCDSLHRSVEDPK